MEKLSRRTARENAFLAAFAATFDDMPLAEVVAKANEAGDFPLDDFAQSLLRAYYDNSAEINDLIRANLKGWTIERIPRVNLTVLRLAIAEAAFGPERLPGVAINEAVELCKKYAGETDYQFVNGLLGNVVRQLGLEPETAEATEQV